jgi:putative spermidine/putrescine transport system substrate-binding protein
MSVSKRTALKLIGGTTAGTLVGVAPTRRSGLFTPALGDTSTLTVSIFGGVIQDAVKAHLEPEFKKLTGASVSYDIGGVGARYNKLLVQKNNPTIDVFVSGEEAIVSGIKANVLTPIVRKNLPNLADVASWAQVVKTGATAEAIGGVPWAVNGYVLSFNPERVKDPPTSWNDMWRPEFAGKIAIASPVHAVMPGFVIMAADLAGGSITNVDPGFKKLAELRPSKLTVFWTDWAAMLKTGDTIAASEFNFYLEGMKSEKYPIEYIIPKEKGIGSVAHVGLVTGTKNRELSEAFINLMIDPGVQKAFSTSMYNGPTNQKVALSDSEIARCTCGAKPNQLRFIDPEFAAAQRPAWTERLNLEVVPQWKTR